jgi:beta-glucosidase
MEADGPAQIGVFTGTNPGTGFPSSSTLAQSWNQELALAEGRIIGHQAAQRGYSGWYAPAVNMHRSPFNGRNYEYYSEDAHLSGQICGNTVAGALDAGTFCYVKHFLCNDGESGIYRDGIYIWMTEQTLREVYLEPFRIIVEEYGATGIMSSYNRVGAVWAGGSLGLLTGILRQEWNFQGAVITDYADHHDFMNGDQMIRTGGDLWMDGMVLGTLKCETASNSFWQAMRQASKNIVYMTLNAQVENRNYVAQSGDTDLTRPRITVEMPLWQKILIGLDVVSVALFALALRAVILDVQVKRSLRKAKEPAAK